MSHHFNCCVPECTNNFRNKPDLHYYRIPKSESARKYYKIALRNETLKLDSNQTRICSVHFEGGEKLSRNHLPTIFPWTRQSKPRREITKHELVPEKKKVRTSTNNIDESLTKSVESPVTTQAQTKINSLEVTKKSSYPREGQPEEIQQNVCVNEHSQTDTDLASFEEVLRKLCQLEEENTELRENCE